jgi:hypothetical protein
MYIIASMFLNLTTCRQFVLGGNSFQTKPNFSGPASETPHRTEPVRFGLGEGNRAGLKPTCSVFP